MTHVKQVAQTLSAHRRTLDERIAELVTEANRIDAALAALLPTTNDMRTAAGLRPLGRPRKARTT